MSRIPTGSLYRQTFKTASGEKRVVSNWWAKWYVPGEKKARRESTGTDDRAKALKFLRRKMAAEGAVRAECTRVADLLELVAGDYLDKGRKSYSDLRARIDAHLEPFFGAMAPDALQSAQVRAYRQKRKADKIEAATVARELAILRRAFSLGARHTPPLCGPAPYIDTTAQPAIRTGILPNEKYIELRNAFVDPLPRLAFVISYHTGARKGEILDIRWSSVDFKMKRIHLGRTKNGEPRYLPIYADMQAYLEMTAQRPGCDYVFHRDGLPVSGFRKAWETACKAIGLPALHFHDLRRTALTNMELAGIPRAVAMAISGHKTEAVYLRYQIVRPDAINAAGDTMTTYLDKQRGENKSESKH